jgi:hypothetical protein
MFKYVDHTNTRAAIANSLCRAESLSVTPAIMDRYIMHEPVACEIIASWEPCLAWSSLIVTLEALDA